MLHVENGWPHCLLLAGVVGTLTASHRRSVSAGTVSTEYGVPNFVSRLVAFLCIKWGISLVDFALLGCVFVIWNFSLCTSRSEVKILLWLSPFVHVRLQSTFSSTNQTLPASLVSSGIMALPLGCSL